MLKFAKPESKAAERDTARRLREANRRIIYRLVSKRDEHACRACHAKGPMHHHHLKLRSAGGQDTEQNLLLLCAECHADRHAARLLIIGSDARFLLQFQRVG